MKILITGYLGFIGSSLTPFLINKYPNYSFILIDSCTYAANKHLQTTYATPDARIVEGNLNIKDIGFFGPYPDVIINLAAESHVANSILDCSPFIDTNILGVKSLLEYCKKSGATLIHFSTDEVYGDKPPMKGHCELDLLSPSNPYSATKASADMLIKSYARTYGVKNAIFRVTNNYGFHQHEEKLIPSILKSLKNISKLEELNFPLHDLGKPKRNWLNVMDTCHAVDMILNECLRRDINEIYNCNGDCELENKQVLSKILSCWEIGDTSNEEFYFNNIEEYADFSFNRPGQDVRYYLDDRKLRAMGWYTKIDFDKEITEIVKKEKNEV